jgi:hypothetical protein
MEYRINWEIYIPYAGTAGMLLHINGKLILSFHILFRYIDDVLSLNNSRFGDFVDRIYPIELKIKDTIDTDKVRFVPSLDKVFVSTLAILFNVKDIYWSLV